MGDFDASTFTLSLRPPPGTIQDESDTDELLRRMYQQRGHFRHITEAGLEQEITDGPKEQDSPEEGEEKAQPTDKERKDKIWATRNEMLGYLLQANNEAAFARDFISLLLSKDAPASATVSISQNLKNAVPMASLTWDNWVMPDPTPTEIRREEFMSEGARLTALSHSADVLLQAATRLEKDVRKETKYWEEVLSITEKGWAVRRIQQERFNLGVQLGFAEAGEQFKRRGFTPLRTDEDGSVILDEELTKTPKAVRVRILENGIVTGTSNLPEVSTLEQMSTEDLIRRARNSLFDEELFHEMSLESRILLPYNVKLQDSVLHIPSVQSPESTSIGCEIQVDLLELGETATQERSGPEDDTAQAVVLALRILLSHIHRQRLRKRSELPPPLTSKKEQRHAEAIIRPIMSLFTHIHDSFRVRDYLRSVATVLQSAGLGCEVSFHTSPQIADLHSTLVNGSASAADTLVNVVIQPLHSTANIAIPIAQPTEDKFTENLNITITTIIAAPSAGTIFTLQRRASPKASLSTNSKFTYDTVNSLTEAVTSSLAREIVTRLLVPQFPLWVAHDHEPELYKSDDEDRTGTAVVSLTDRELRLKVTTLNQVSNQGEPEKSMPTRNDSESVWTPDEKGESRGWSEVIMEAFV